MSKPASFFDLDMQKLMTEFRVPGLDVEGILASQRRNIEAITKANQLALEGFQTLARRQAEIVRGGFEQAQSAMQEVMQSKSPTERVQHHTELAKRSVESAIANARELAEIAAKAQAEAFEVLNKRLGESFEEVKGLVAK